MVGVQTIAERGEQAQEPLLELLPPLRIELVFQPGIVGHFGEHFMAGRHFREMHVGFDADPLEGFQKIVRERVVEILGDRVGIFRQAPAIHFWSPDRSPTDDPADAVRQMGGNLVGCHLFTQLPLLLGREHPVQPCQECSQGETHAIAPIGGNGGESFRRSMENSLLIERVAPGSFFRTVGPKIPRNVPSDLSIRPPRRRIGAANPSQRARILETWSRQ